MPVFNCLSCQRLLFRPEEFIGRAWQCPSCGPVNVSDEPVSASPELTDLLEKEYRLGLTAGPSGDLFLGMNPIPEIARKRSLILRYLDPQTPKTRWMRGAFIIGLCLPAILLFGYCVISPPPEIPWGLIFFALLFSPYVGLGMMLIVGCLDIWKNPKYAEIALPDGHSDKLDRKRGHLPDKNPTETEITPSPSRGTIQTDPKSEEPDDA